MSTSRLGVCLFGLATTILVGGCSTAPAPTTAAGSAAFSRDSAATAEQRPGLGTRWGETRQSQITNVSFHRADPAHPIATALVNYNDAAGVRAMTAATPQRRHPQLQGRGANVISLEIRDESGRLLPGVAVNDRWFVVGEAGRRYSIAVRNDSDTRLEVLLSVDGLDVIDGRPASLRKRGYVIRPHDRVEVQGFRQSMDAVAAFRFGSVSESYANRKYGDTRNVGVIGLAVFNEFGTDPFGATEVERRLRADPFPNRFGSPPEPIPVRIPRRP